MAKQLDLDAQAPLCAVAAVATVSPYALPIDQARDAARAALVAKGVLPDLYSVKDVLVSAPGRLLKLRLYRPAEGSLPIGLFLHGEGWTLNDLDTHDRLCRLIARRSGWLLASLEYRHSPENKYPAALEDAYFGYRWLLDNAMSINGDARCRAIIGESSGGTMAARACYCCCAMSARRCLRIRFWHTQRPTCAIAGHPIRNADMAIFSIVNCCTGF